MYTVMPGIALADDARIAPEAVDACVAKAIKYIYSIQKDGTWDPATPQADPRGNKFDWSAEWTNWGGPTALMTYALLAAGESPNDPRIKTAIDFLKKAELKGTYAIGMRSQVWAHLPITAETRRLIARDAELLHTGMITKGDSRGLWWYDGHGPEAHDFDFSNSQYGVLGLWGAADIGLEINSEVWRMMDKAWRDGQQPSGGWAYKRVNDPTIEATVPHFTMTAAGVATLYLTDDYLAPGLGINCGDNTPDPGVEKGLAWLGDHFDGLAHADDIILPGFAYGLYGLERVGVASGRKYIGKVDWYQWGLSHLLPLQGPDGNWRPEQPPMVAGEATALSLLFLAYGRASVAVDKLQWELGTPGAKSANWNERPRDAANFCHWMSRETEAPQKWQVVSLREPVEELHDAPVLYISGNQALNFRADDLAKLKQYVDEGGLILGNANCASHDFADSFRKLGQKLFPGYEFRELPADHVIYTGEQFLRTKWRNKPSVLSLSNGVRELMILIPTVDVSRTWQLQDYRGKTEGFELFSDIILYASDRSVLDPSKGSYQITSDPKVTADQTIKLARLQYDGNWNPEPAGWVRLASSLHNDTKIALTVEAVKLGAGKLDASVYKIAHLTGTAALSLTAPEQAELKKYVDAGGTLIIDAAGGSTAFDAAAQHLVTAIGPVGSKLMPLDQTSPSMAGVKTITVRRFEKTRIGKAKNVLPLAITIQNRAMIFYSPLDLSASLVGEPIDGIAGYDPATASQIVSSIIAYANHK